MYACVCVCVCLCVFVSTNCHFYSVYFHVILCSCTPLPLYPSTPLPLYPSTPLPLYPSTPIPLYPSTPLPLYPSTPLPLYPSTPVPLHLQKCAPFSTDTESHHVRVHLAHMAGATHNHPPQPTLSVLCMYRINKACCVCKSQCEVQ